MIIEYTFSDIEHEVMEDPATHIANQWYEPHYHRIIGDVEYKFEHEINVEDVANFIYEYHNPKKISYDEILTLIKTLDKLEALELEAFEFEKYFYDFIKENYEEDALKECIEGNREDD